MMLILLSSQGERKLNVFSVVVQFGKEASQTRGYCGAQNAPQRAARPDPSLRKKRWLGMTITAPLLFFRTWSNRMG